MFRAMPTAMRGWAAVPNEPACPVTVRDGRDWLDGFAASHALRAVPEQPAPQPSGETAIALSDVWFKYEKDLPDVVKGLSRSVKKASSWRCWAATAPADDFALRHRGCAARTAARSKTNGSVGMLPQNP
jgi:energy-coupling factor transport system ATP-binding protein